MKKLLCMGLIAIMGLSFVACGGNDEKPETDNDKPAVEENEDKEDDKDNEEDKETDKPDEEKPNVEKPDTQKPNPEEKPKPEVDEEDKTERIFKLSYIDVAGNDVVVQDGEIKTIGLGVADNIKKIAATVSTKYFDGKAINLTTIETINDKKIAVIDLAGDASYWNQKMQGSAGAKATEHALINNILQESYTGYWVDGVRFTVDGKAVQDTGHVPNLAKTTYR